MRVKICGLKTPEDIVTSLNHGADYIGLVHFDPSPRHVDLEQMAKLRTSIPKDKKAVTVLVNPTDELLKEITTKVAPDYTQLHGSESPARAKEIKELTNAPIIKAIAIESKDDLEKANLYTQIADYILFDAKAQKDDTLPGGLGRAFDWTILNNLAISTPWFLSGGLNADNVAEAIRITNATHLDTSSGVESSAGQKDPKRIQAFLQTAKAR